MVVARGDESNASPHRTGRSNHCNRITWVQRHESAQDGDVIKLRSSTANWQLFELPSRSLVSISIDSFLSLPTVESGQNVCENRIKHPTKYLCKWGSSINFRIKVFVGRYQTIFFVNVLQARTGQNFISGSWYNCSYVQTTAIKV
jgi:hypothetical protein